MDTILEAVIIACSSTGLIGTIIATLLSRMLKNAKADADKRRTERFQEEMIHSEYDEKTGKLLITLSRFSRGLASEEELTAAENDFSLCVDKMNRIKKEQYFRNLTSK